MAAVVARSMTLGGNIHIYQNCVYTTQPQQIPVSNVVVSGKRLIAPAPANVVVTNNQQQNIHPKKKIQYTQVNYAGTQPTSVLRRNARERNRVKQVNNGFANLRQHIPQDIVETLPKAGRGASKKLSKVDTLRMAVEYIRRLMDILDDADERVSTCSKSYASSHYVDNSLNYSIPTCSEASASPTPSYTSETSNCNNIYAQSEYISLAEYENYGSKSSDEELLDVISNWQDENGFLRQS